MNATITAPDVLMDQLRSAWQVEYDCIRAIGQDLRPIVSLIHRIQHCEGKVVLSGVGKSGLLCKRVSASLASIGTNNLFLHAYEAMHGDLGLIREDDLVIAVSHSGETKEVVSLLEMVKDRGITTIAITAGADSRLSQLANETILYPQAESCVFQFLPTSSLTSVNVIFNLVLIGLTLEEQISEKDLAINHPNGSLGLRFFKTVRDYCRLDCPEIGADQTLRAAILAINEGVYGMCFVMENGRRLGILTSGDIRRALLEGNIDQILVQDIYNASPKTVSPDTSAYEARLLMRRQGIAFLVIADEEDLLGITLGVDIV